MEIELVIFDWSGVISDDRKPVYEVNMRILRDHKKPTMSFEEWLPRTTMTPVEFFANHGVHEDPEELYALYKKYYGEAVESGITPVVYPDAYETLRYLKKNERRMAVLSSHPVENLKREAEEYEVTSFLSLIRGSAQNKVEGLQAVCEQLDTRPDSALFVGDTVYDIRAAKEAGLLPVGICTGYHTKERLEKEGPDLLLGCLSDLRDLFSFSSRS